MSLTSYEYLAILQFRDNRVEGETRAAKKYDYTSVLHDVRAGIAQDHAQELADVLQSEDAATTLRSLIVKYTAERMAGQDYNSGELVDRIYEDMAGLGILTRYLYDEHTEEINGNSFDQIELVTASGETYLTGKDAFASPDAAQDIIKRMVRMGGMLLDAQTPKVDSYIKGGIRISASIPPLVPEDAGVVFSIRKQSKVPISRQAMLDSGVAPAPVIDFLTTCLCNSVSVGIAGSTGSGKTTTETFLLDQYITRNEEHNNRIYLIEDSREISLPKWDTEHDRPARVIYNTTDDEWPMIRLVEDALRYHPKLIVPAEVRNGAAFAAAQAGTTGHTILTSFHANSAASAYGRLKELCVNANSGQSGEELLRLCVEAWPIMIFMEQLKDNSRKITGVYEATGISDDGKKVEGRYLWRYVIEKNIRDERGRIQRIEGTYQRGTISPRLFSWFIGKGVDKRLLLEWFPDAKEEE